MAKPINIKNPVGAIRSALRLSREEFALLLDHSAASLKLVESGFRPIGDDLAKKIAFKTGLPIAAIKMKRWGKTEREEYRPHQVGGFGNVDEMEPLFLLPKILALYCSLVQKGIDGRFSTMAIDYEIRETAKRFGIDQKTISDATDAFNSELFGVLAEKQGIDKPAIDLLKPIIRNAKPWKNALEACRLYSERAEKLMFSNTKQFYAFIDEQNRRASQKTPKSKKGVFADLADMLPPVSTTKEVKSPKTP